MNYVSCVWQQGLKINLSISYFFTIFAKSKSNTLIIKILDMSKLLLLGDEAIAQAFNIFANNNQFWQSSQSRLSVQARKQKNHFL